MQVKNEVYIFTQALNDGMGYPKSDEAQRMLSFSNEDLRTLYEKLSNNPSEELNTLEKQMILNCIDGALDYVGTDIHSLYDIPQTELQSFKELLEERWGIQSAYRNQ